MLGPERLGSARFRQDYGLRMAYVAGAMVKGIASADLVIRLGKAGCLSFYGSGGMRPAEVEAAIRKIQGALDRGEPYGVNLLSEPSRPHQEMERVDLLLRLGVRTVEASAFMQVTPALVKFRLKGPNRIIAKISRPEVAALFLAPPPAKLVERLVEEDQLTREDAALAARLPLASDICVEADSGGHTDMGVTSVLLPAMIRLRDEMQLQHRYEMPVGVGAGGGIGTPEAAACAFLLGADFIVTGSINQCTVEAGTSDTAKDMLQAMNVQDTAYAPAGDMFEMGSKVQVMKKGVFFPAKASKLYDLWRTHGSLEAIDAATAREIQDKYLRRSFDEVYRETRDFYAKEAPAEIERAERNPKARMALVFRWYFVHTMRLAMEGKAEHRVDYQVHTGPALGAFNQWVKGTALEDWRHRHVDAIGAHLMQACADYMDQRIRALS
ncbi:MAG: PfaD family polyunsaturated fatty acid/polyketide biosynthesis protein [Alphaproteobacteria bacterium]|nr:PfaD family polyunsaturated fatty acid/polyketide biosynthesis protein [Alphaproteobacteria bacterium]